MPAPNQYSRRALPPPRAPKQAVERLAAVPSGTVPQPASGGGSSPSGDAGPATDTALGLVELSLPSDTPSAPVVVGDNDPRVAATSDDSTQGGAAYTLRIMMDAYGHALLTEALSIAIDTSQLVSGTLADARLPDEITAVVIPGASHAPGLSFDTKGRLVGYSDELIAIDASQIVTGRLAEARLPKFTIDREGGITIDREGNFCLQR